MRHYLYRVITDEADDFAAVPIRFFLWAFSLVYRSLVELKNWLYDKDIFKAADLGRPVISIGNITWGGVGKTPCVSFLAQYLKSKGFKPAILTRGYMKNAAASDEVQVFRQEIPGIVVGVGKNRVASAQKVKEEQAVDLFILDDGFQHRKVHRGLDIVLIDANKPFGNGQLIPRGILREPMEALKRADLIVLTKTDVNPSAAIALEERLKGLCPKVAMMWAVHRPQCFVELMTGQELALSDLALQKVISVSGIGDPHHFIDILLGLGIQCQENLIFEDHHDYSKNDIHQMITQARSAGVEHFVMTSKDASKIIHFKKLFESAKIKCWVLKIQFEIQKGKDQILGRVDHLLGR